MPLRVPYLHVAIASISLVSPAAAQPVGTNQQNNVSIRGAIRASDGSPLRGARVTVRARGSTSGVFAADENGRYEGRLPFGAPYRITVSKPGYAPAVTDNLAGTQGDVTIDVTLERGAAVGGIVVDRFGDPAVGLGIHVVSTDPLRKAETHVAQSDERGTFRIGSLPDGSYTIQMTRGGVSFNRSELTLAIPMIDNYSSTSTAVSFTIARHEDVSLTLTYDSGPNTVELGRVAVESFEANQVRSGRPPVRRDSANGSSVEGWVTDPSGRTARGAVVELQPVDEGQARRTSTGADGRYSLAGIAPGRYVIWARNDAFVPTQFDESMRPAGQVIQVRGRTPMSVPLTMTRGSVIEGTVVDRFGDPIEGAAIELRTVNYASGRALIAPTGLPTVRLTDDRGHYSFAEVGSGSYYVMARDGIGQVFYPDRASAAQATAIDIDGVHEVRNIDIQFHPQAFGHVRGRVTDTSGAGSPATLLLIESARSGATVAERLVQSTKDGDFEFASVPPGQYVIQAIRRSLASLDYASPLLQPSLTDPVRFDTTAIAIAEGETVSVTLQLRPGASMLGHFRIPGWREEMAPAVMLEAVGADPDRAPLDALGEPSRTYVPPGLTMPPDAGFSVANLIGPVVFQLKHAPAGWWLKSIGVEGAEASRTPTLVTRAIDDVEAEIATDGATLTGHVNGERVALLGATVLLFTVDPGVWFPGSQFVRRVQTPRNGTFKFGSLPPGDYFVVAVDDVPLDPARSDWQSPAALNAVSTRATRVHLSSSQRRTIELPLKP